MEKSMLVELYEALCMARREMIVRGIDTGEKVDAALARARPTVEAIRSGELVPVEVQIEVTTDDAWVTRTKYDGFEWCNRIEGNGQLTRATVYARRPAPTVHEGHAEGA